MTPREQVGQLYETAPDVVRLAEEVSLAVLVDPALLRRARLDLGAGVGTEADLWFSALVKSSSPSGFVILPEIAAELRRRLADDPGRLRRARRRVAEAHAGYPPSLRLEEDVLWLSVSREPDATAEIEMRLRSALAAMVRDGREGIASWAARALPSFPISIRVLESSRILEAGARLRLDRDGRALADLDWAADGRDTGWIVPPDFPQTTLRVRLLEDGVELARDDSAPGHAVMVPWTEPIMLEVEWLAAAPEPAAERRWIGIPVGSTAGVPGPVSGGVRLRTLGGTITEVWSTELRLAAASRRAPLGPGERPITPLNPRQQQRELESLFVQHLPFIERMAAKLTRDDGLFGDEADDFVSWAKTRLIEDDYAALRRFRGESALTTYLAAVLVSLYRDYRIAESGRWRPSAEARRQGPDAIALERLVYRDGHTLLEAISVLRSRGETVRTERELAQLFARLPASPRGRPAPVDEETLSDTRALATADEVIRAEEADAERARMVEALWRAIETLPHEDQVVVRMRFMEGLSTADIARALRLEQKPLYRRLERLLTRLRELLEAAGISQDTVRNMVLEDEED